MKYFSAVKDRINDSVIDTVQCDTDYIDTDGDLHIHVKKPEVMVTAKSDLANLTGYEPSTIAYTAGLANVWQLGADGNWVAIFEEASSSEASDSRTLETPKQIEEIKLEKEESDAKELEEENAEEEE